MEIIKQGMSSLLTHTLFYYFFLVFFVFLLSVLDLEAVADLPFAVEFDLLFPLSGIVDLHII